MAEKLERLFCCDSQNCRQDTRVDVLEFCDGKSCMGEDKNGCSECDDDGQKGVGGSGLGRGNPENDSEKVMRQFLEICGICNIPYDPAATHSHENPPFLPQKHWDNQTSITHSPIPVHALHGSPANKDQYHFEGQGSGHGHGHDGTFGCHWGFCNRQFTTMNDLASHVNLEHLQPAPARIPPLPLKTEDLIQLPSSQHLEQQNQQDAVTETSRDDLYCLWDDCHRLPEDLFEIDHTMSGQEQSLTEKPKSLLLQHLVQDHLQMDPIDLLQFVSNPSFSLPTEPQIGISPDSTTNQSSVPLPPSASSFSPPPVPFPSTQPHLYPTSTSTLASTSKSNGNSSSDLAAYLRVPGRARRSVANSNSGIDGALICKWPACGLEFATTALLMEHLGKDHIGSGKKEYVCLWEGCERDEIGRVFKQRQKIMRHLQSHTGDRPFVCDECGKAFTEATTLQQHKRTHTKEKPFVCTHPDCGKSFALASALTIHMRTHTGDKPFTCPQCDTSFAESSNLSKHMKIHRTEKDEWTAKYVNMEVVTETAPHIPIAFVYLDQPIESANDVYYFGGDCIRLPNCACEFVIILDHLSQIHTEFFCWPTQRP
ncbi:hypothetical protein BT69DRAFT_1348704 [Atractiella rhizophila]|nr:hypothetical protein BT69DRAFT_1348704 [Atractiella rhizophila]